MVYFNTPKELAEALNFIKHKVNQNVKKIKDNCDLINSTKSNNNTAGKEIIVNNDKMIRENQDLIEIQRKIHEYLKKHFPDKLDLSLQNKSEEEIFLMTIKGQIEYSGKHPFIKSKKFAEKLISYYSENEEYEKCQLILNHINNSFCLLN